jgi:FAD/FMN-containing dehydrogenase
MGGIEKVAKYLNEHISGSVFFAPRILEQYSTDKSILKIKPQLVALPETTHDVRKLVRFSNQLATKKIKLPVTVRGSGSDKTGASIGNGMVISMEHMNKIQEIDPRQKLVRLQAGVTLGELNSALALHGLTIPISADHAQTIGGLIGNYHHGNYSRKHGDITHFISQAEVVLSSGDCIQTERVNARTAKNRKGFAGFEGEIYRKLSDLLDENSDLIEEIIEPKNIDAAGYEMIHDVRRKDGSFDLMPLFYGAQGTLGVITEVIMHCDYLAPKPNYFFAQFKKFESAKDLIKAAIDLDASEINIYDNRLFDAAEELGKNFDVFRTRFDDGYLVAIAFDDRKVKPRWHRLKALSNVMKTSKNWKIYEGEDGEDAYSFASAISIYLNSAKKGERIGLVDDVFIPDDGFVEFVGYLKLLEEKYKTKLPIFGSAANNIYSVRPDIDLSTEDGRNQALSFLKDLAKAVSLVGGSITGGSPGGRTKAVYVNRIMDKRLKKLYKLLKAILDPNEILNPGVKIDADLPTLIKHLKTTNDLGIILA